VPDDVHIASDKRRSLLPMTPAARAHALLTGIDGMTAQVLPCRLVGFNGAGKRGHHVAAPENSPSGDINASVVGPCAQRAARGRHACPLAALHLSEDGIVFFNHRERSDGYTNKCRAILARRSRRSFR